MNPLEKLWIGRCTIYSKQEVTNPDTYETTFEDVPIIVDEPCRVSFDRNETTDIISGAPVVSQIIMLFIRPDLTIPAGSVIEVTQHDKTVKYQRSSEPSIYTNHQEIILELYEVNA